MANDVVLKIEKNHTILLESEGMSEEYNLKEIPSSTSILVTQEKVNILHQMDLKTVIQNLDNSVDLLNVAYHAVYGFNVGTQIWSLQKMLMDLNDKGINVIDDFQRQSSAIIGELIGVFDWLTKGAEVMAIKKLERFASIASGMSKQAQNLASDYQTMANMTSTTLKETMTENNRQYANQEKIQNEMNEFQSEQEAADAAQKAIKDRLIRLKDEYNNLNKAEISAEKHQRTMDIMGAVFSFLGSAMSVAAEATSKSSSSSKSGEEDSRKLEEAKQEERKAKERVLILEEEKTSLASAFENEKDSAKKDKLRESIRTNNFELDEAKKLLSKKSSTLSKLSDAFSKISTDIQGQTGGRDVVAENRSKRLTELNAELIRLEEEQTKQLSNLAKYTRRLDGMVIQNNSVEAAIRSLIVAISCLKNVVVAVMDIALFWTSMEKCCKELATSGLKDTIKDLQDIDKDTRIEFYYSDSVMFPLLSYMVKWAAVRSISMDFIKGAEETRARLNETIKTSDSSTMNREQHWDLASKTASVVANKLEEQVESSQQKTKTLQG